ncbi:MAG: ATP-binding protein [Verrucomicrobiota bacterium]
MKRDIESKFEIWMRRSKHKPLLVRGARQVGKTFSIREFGSRFFKTLAFFDLERQRSLHQIFAGDLDPRVILPQLEAQIAKQIKPGESLLFLDEIQACPRALMALRYFYEEMPELHVIAAGSLLEFVMEDFSFPVGRVEFIWMYPMTFAEFLRARDKDLLAERRPDLNASGPIAPALHTKLIEELRMYFIVGGLPEAVETFVRTNSLTAVVPVHQAISQAYLQDFAKYAPRVDEDCLRHIFESVPAQAGRQIKYTRLYPEKRANQIKRVLRVLEQALVVHKVNASSAQGLPLGASASDRVFKCVFADIGLMRHMCGLPAKDILAERDLLDTFRGALAEQFIGQQMLAERGGSEHDRLYYWIRLARNSSAEVDYLLVRDGRIFPVEVKSGPPGKLQSLKLFLAEHPQSPGGLVFHSGNVHDAPDQKVKFLPLYTRLNEPGGEERLAASDADLAAGHIHQGTVNQLLGALTREPGP